MLMFLGRYGKQSAVELERRPTVTIVAWVREIETLMAEEAQQAKAGAR